MDLTKNAEGTMTKYWAFARGGAWRSPKPTGGPYVCEQCRLDACGYGALLWVKSPDVRKAARVLGIKKRDAAPASSK